MVDITQSLGSSAGAATATARASTDDGQAKGALSSDFETFLNLLTAQIKNQDPTEPVDSTQWVSQLATFSAVEQQVLTNDLLGDMNAQLGLSGLSDVASWVGMEARVNAPAYYDGASITLAPDPPTVTDKIELVATNTLGVEVYRAEIPATSDPVEWSGLGVGGTPLPDGNYAFTIDSYINDEVITSRPVEAYVPVSEVRSLSGVTSLVLAGGTVVPADTVTALREVD